MLLLYVEGTTLDASFFGVDIVIRFGVTWYFCCRLTCVTFIYLSKFRGYYMSLCLLFAFYFMYSGNKILNQQATSRIVFCSIILTNWMNLVFMIWFVFSWFSSLDNKKVFLFFLTTVASSPEVKTVLGHHMVVGIKDLTLLFSQGYQSITE